LQTDFLTWRNGRFFEKKLGKKLCKWVSPDLAAKKESPKQTSALAGTLGAQA